MSAIPFIILSLGFGFSVGAALARLAMRTSLQRTPSVVLVGLGITSAVAAALSHGHPTSVLAVDVVLRAGVGALFVFWAAKARRLQLLAAAAVVAVPMALGAVDSSLAPWILGLGVGTMGAAAASYLNPQRVPIFGGLVGALVAQGALRLPTTLPARVPSLMAALALAVVFVSARVNLSHIVRRRLIRGAVAVAGVGFVCAIAGVVALVNARAQVERGVAASKNGLAAARSGDTATADTDFNTARVALVSARRHLESPLARMGLVVPVLAQHISTIHQLTTSATKVVDAAERTTSHADLQAFRAEGGRVDVAKMVALRTQVVAADTAITEVRAALDAAGGPWLVPPLTNRVASLRTQVDDAARSTANVRQILDVVPAMLGANGPRRYLLVTPTPAEARGSGGVIGNYGEITADNGVFALARFGRNSELNTNGTPGALRYLQAPADYVARYRRFGAAILWQNVNMSPDFAASAEAMAGLYPQSGGRPVDGVISVDPIGLASFLQLLGPVSVSSWPVPITAATAAKTLMLDAYVVKGGGTQDRYTLLADVAQTVWKQLTVASLPNPKALATTLGPAVKGRHLQIWMRGRSEQQYLSSIGLAGDVPVVNGDSLGVVVNNGSGGKIEWFLQRSLTYDAVVDSATGTVASTATVTLSNNAPSVGLPDYIIENLVPGEHLEKGTSRMYVSLYSPLALLGATVDGAALAMTSETELGRNVYSGWVTIPSKGSVVVKVQLSGAIAAGKQRYRLDVFHQPLVSPDILKVTVRGANGQAMVATSGLSVVNGTLTGEGVDSARNTFAASFG